MNCKQVRGHLLQAELPTQPGAAVQTHLVACGDCRQWQRRLIEVERLIPDLPVPPSSGKAELFARLAQEPTPAPSQPLTPVRSPLRIRRWFESPALPPAGLAAGLLLFAFVWWMLQGKREQALVQDHRPGKLAPPPDVLLANLMERNLRLARANTPRDRLAALTDIADDLHGETQALVSSAADEQDLTILVQCYSKVVQEGVIERAKSLPAAERGPVLPPLADRLARMEKQAEKMAEGMPTASAESLRKMAKAAREGTRQLRSLMPEEP